MDASMLKGMAVVAIAEGTRLGRIDEVLFDPAERRAAGLRLRGNGHRRTVPYAEVRSVGADAVMVASEQIGQLPDTDGTAGLVGLRRLGHLKVVDEAGTFLGIVGSVEIAPENGRIVRLQARKGGLWMLGGEQTTIEVEAIRGIGPELATVAITERPAPRPATAAPGRA